MAINTKLTTIENSCLDIRDAIKESQRNLAEGSITTLGNDIRTLNNNNYVYKWVENNGTYSLERDLNNGTSIAQNGYIGKNNIISVILPSNITTLGRYAFQRCYKLQYINLENITTIGQSCFALESGTLSNSNQYDLCVDLNIPKLNSLGGGAFANTKITKIINLGNITSLEVAGGGIGPFTRCLFLQTANLPNTLTTIGQYSFKDCPLLTTITVEGTQNFSVGQWAFRYDTKLTTFPFERVTYVGGYAFSECNSLPETINLDNCTSIGGVYAIGNNTSIKTIILSDKITNINSRGFQNCSKLQTFVCKATTPPTLGSTNAFDQCSSLTNIYLPYSSDHSVLEAYQTASVWTSFASKMAELNVDGSIPT